MDRTSLIIAGCAGIAALYPVLAMVAGNWSWQFRSVVVLWATLFVWMTYSVAQDHRGYPIEGTLPDEFHLIWSIVDEPTATSPGRIIIWYRVEGTVEPKAVQIPYSRAKHEWLQKGKDKASTGEDVYVRKMRDGKPADGPETSGQPSDDDYPMDFVPPPSTAPEKTHG